jgi:ubiquinone/menaquinone biosynthesis C-methylase UbiE
MNVGRRVLMRMFGRPQGVLGRLGGVIMARVNRDAASQVIGVLDLQPDDRVVEIGFGPGVAIALLTERVSGGAIAGVDPSPDMLGQAQARNAAAIEAGKVDLRLGVVARLPFPDAAFDKAFTINSMQVWPDAGAGLREIHRVLRRGGVIALAFTVNSGQARRGVAEMLSAAGFAQPQIRDGERLFCVVASKP